MRRVLMILILSMSLAIPVSAVELYAPEVPDSAARFMPTEPENLGQALMEVLRSALLHFSPSLRDGAALCVSLAAVAMLLSLLRSFPGTSAKTTDLAGTVAASVLMLGSAGSMINLAVKTVAEISEYGKLLLPVMTAALAAEGGATASVSLYAGTAMFDTLLSSLITKLLTPMIYIFLALAAAASAVGEEFLKKLRDTVKGSMTWILKTILYVYTGFISITGVISGSTDAAALKAAKLTISGAVPVVGGILSDASEAVLVGAGAVKNAAGVYGMFAIIAIWLGPFLKIGAQYLLLKAASLVCAIFGSKTLTDLIGDFSAAMGLLLGMTGAVCLMLLISMVCFMKGVL